jgi:hypothetical protein
VTQSWRRKVERAEHHLGDLRARVAPVEERRVYPVTERLEPHDEGEAYVHRVRIPQPDDSLLPIVAGELGDIHIHRPRLSDATLELWRGGKP